MLDFDSVLQRLNDRGVDVNELEALFKTSLKNALLNFTSAAEARSFIERADKEFFISRRTEFVDLGNNRGNAPVNYWKKECRFCRATFETTDRRQAYCDAPGHRQRYYEMKKSAELFLEVVGGEYRLTLSNQYAG